MPAREQDRRLSAALLAAALAHTPEAENRRSTRRGMRAARKPQALARELLRNFPKRRGRSGRKRRRQTPAAGKAAAATVDGTVDGAQAPIEDDPDELIADQENGEDRLDGEDELSLDGDDELEPAA